MSGPTQALASRLQTRLSVAGITTLGPIARVLCIAL